MKYCFYKRITPRLSVVRLVGGRSKVSAPKYIGIRFNLIFWALEIYATTNS